MALLAMSAVSRALRNLICFADWNFCHNGTLLPRGFNDNVNYWPVIHVIFKASWQ